MMRNEEIMEMCRMLAENDNLRVCIAQASRGSFYVGCGAFAGALLAGPMGMALGGTAASIATAWNSRSSYRSVVDVLKYDFTPEQRDKFINVIRNQLSKVKPEQCVALITLVSNSTSLKKVILKEMGAFFMKEMNLYLVR